MKVVKIILGVLAGLYALGQCVQLSIVLFSGPSPSALLGILSCLCLGAAISVLLLRSAFRHKTE